MCPVLRCGVFWLSVDVYLDNKNPIFYLKVRQNNQHHVSDRQKDVSSEIREC